MKEIEKYIKDFDGGHSDFQIEQFIIGSQGHNFFKYKQACREIAARYELIKSKKGKNCQAARRELAALVEIAKELRRVLNWDELSNDKKRVLERHAWFEKARYMLAVDLICSRGRAVSKVTVEFILQLPKEYRRELIDSAMKGGGHQLIEWVMNK